MTLWAARKRLLARLQEVRRNGCSIAHNEPVGGVRSDAVLIGKPEVDIVAALAVASMEILGEKHNAEEIVEGLKETGIGINRTIGLRP